jgi:hypothetical protein
VLEAQIKRRPAMKKVSTVAAKPSKNLSQFGFFPVWLASFALAWRVTIVPYIAKFPIPIR